MLGTYSEEFEGGVNLEYTSVKAMSDEQRKAFIDLLPITFEDTLCLTKGAQLDIIFGVGNWICKTPPQDQSRGVAELIGNFSGLVLGGNNDIP